MALHSGSCGPGRPKADGFTLMELLVAMALLFIVLTLVYESFQIHVKTMKAARALQREDRVARLALDMMARDLLSLYVDPQALAAQGQEGEEKAAFFIVKSQQDGEMHRDRIAFLTLGPSLGMEQPEHPWVHEVEYLLSEDPDTRKPLLVRREDPTPDDDLLSGGQQWLLAEGVVGFQVECIGPEGDTSSSWDSRSSDPPIPTAVSLKLWIMEGAEDEASRPQQYSITVTLPSLALPEQA